MSQRDKWEEAYKKASFYKSSQSTKEYWDKVSEADGGGLAGDKHIMLIKDYLINEGLITKDSSILDIGCGGGDYVIAFSKVCNHVTGLDYSEKMINLCRKNCENAGITNVTYEVKDFITDEISEKYDCVLSCLNPSTYNPDAMDKMLSISKGTVVYFSMDSSLENADKEPVYCGCNSVRIAEEYLKEKQIEYTKIPYTYDFQMPDNSVRKIEFAYLVIKSK